MGISETHIIGGITGGIGSRLAQKFANEGHKVAGFARSDAGAEFESFETLTCDATDASSVADGIEELYGRIGQVDSYTHAIGSIFLKPAHLTSPEDFTATMQTNLSSAFYALRAVARLMMKQGSGSILFFSTAAAQTGIANHEAIAAAKGGIEAMVRSAAATYSARGIRVNAIAPSLTDTQLAKPLIGDEKARRISEKMHPLGQIGSPDDIASLAQWLHSDAAKFVTGQTFVVDGGISSIVPKPKM